MIWVLSILLILSDGTASGKMYYAHDPQFNTEQDCKTVGDMLSKDLQSKSAGSKAYFYCQEIDTKDMQDGLSKDGQPKGPQL